jgi:hypothetical protein
MFLQHWQNREPDSVVDMHSSVSRPAFERDELYQLLLSDSELEILARARTLVIAHGNAQS